MHGELVLGSRSVDGLRLEATRANATLTVSGHVPIADPTPSDPARLDLRVDAARWPLTQARPWLPANVASLPLEGLFSGAVTLSGPLAALTGEVEGGLADARLGAVALGEVRTTLRFDADTLQVPNLVAALPAGDVQAHGTLRFADQGLDFKVHAPALQLAAPPFAGLAGQLTGSLEVQADIAGTVDRPAIGAKVLGHDLAVLEREVGDHGSSVLDVDWHERSSRSGSLVGLLDVDGGGTLDESRPILRSG